MAEQEVNQKTADRDNAPANPGRLAHSIGMGLPDGTMRVFLPKGSRLPCDESSMRILARLKEYSKVMIQIFMGESTYVDDNIFIGELGLENIKLNKEGQALLDIIFSVDENNLLHVSIKDEPGKKISNGTFRIETDAVPSEPGVPGQKPARRMEDFSDREFLLEKLMQLEKKIEGMEKEIGVHYKEELEKNMDDISDEEEVE